MLSKCQNAIKMSYDYLLGAVKINSLFKYCVDKDSIKKKLGRI